MCANACMQENTNKVLTDTYIFYFLTCLESLYCSTLRHAGCLSYVLQNCVVPESHHESHVNWLKWRCSSLDSDPTKNDNVYPMHSVILFIGSQGARK